MLLQTSGLDAVVVTMFFAAGVKTFLFGCIFGVIMLLVNATAPCPGISVNTDGSCAIVGLDVISLANIDDNSPRLWSNAIFLYFISGFGIWQLYKVYEQVCFVLDLAWHFILSSSSFVLLHESVNNSIVCHFSSQPLSPATQGEPERLCDGHPLRVPGKF